MLSDEINCTNGVLLFVDWDNVFHSIFNDFGPDKMNLNHRFQRLMHWVESDLGKLLDGYGFIFAPSHFSAHHRDMCVRNHLRIVICPKRKSKQTNARKEEDTVDETIIWFGQLMINHPGVKIICLVSGDEDFVPLLELAKKKGIKIALVPPTINSLSTSKRILEFIDNHPKTGKKMALRLDRV